MSGSSEKSLENLPSQETSKFLPTPKADTSSSTRMLSPSEIKSLRESRKEMDKISKAYFEKKYGKTGKKPDMGAEWIPECKKS